MRPIIHLLLHFVVPGLVARFGFPNRWKSVWLLMILTMAVDLDHLFADPLYDPNRCGIGLHPLHSYPAILGYVVLTVPTKTRVIGLGLVIHMLLDGIDCVWLKLEQ